MSDHRPTEDSVWPDYLMIRDTGIIPDDGGGRIYTTVGFGYEKRKYVRADLGLPPERIPSPFIANMRAVAACLRVLSQDQQRIGGIVRSELFRLGATINTDCDLHERQST